ncbi:MAG: vWA domain-containing protein [Pseudoclavibacter sp.]
MTWNPIWPAWLVVIVTLLLVGLCVVALIQATRRKKRIDWVLRGLVVVLIGIACLRPGLGSQAVEAQQSELDVLFVVDTTASMNAEDWSGGPRLDGVKADVAEIALAHSGARFSLITFDSKAVRRLPFTNDATALQSIVDNLRPEITMYSGGSSVTVANGLVNQVLGDAQEQGPDRARVVYYFGDGEQTSSESPDSFDQAGGKTDGGAVFGYGTAEGGPMLETLPGFTDEEPEYITTAGGETAVSVIDEGNLTNIANELGVGLQLRTPDSSPEPADVQVEAGTGGADVETAFDLYWIFAIAAFALMLREVWINVRGIAELRGARGVTDVDD